MSERILVVEDDESILAGLRLNLEMDGFIVECARDGVQAMERFRRSPPDLVLLDVMLPGMNGFEVLEEIRHENPDVAVLMLSARGAQEDKVRGLGLGADDYVAKPFSLVELLARINAQLRRKRLIHAPDAEPIMIGDVALDRASRRASRLGEPIEMTTREFDLLMFLAERPDRVVTRAQILDQVWGGDYEGTERTIDNFIGRLRQKIESSPDRPEIIQTVRGVGYRFVFPGSDKGESP